MCRPHILKEVLPGFRRMQIRNNRYAIHVVDEISLLVVPRMGICCVSMNMSYALLRNLRRLHFDQRHPQILRECLKSLLEVVGGGLVFRIFMLLLLFSADRMQIDFHHARLLFH